MNFVKEGKLKEDEKKRREKRQAEWEKVRQKDDPIEAPEEEIDDRPLYDKLKEQHEIKKKDYEESYALKNVIRGVDEDEAGFLSEIDHIRFNKEKEIRLEEKKEIEELKKASKSATSPEMPKLNLSIPLHKKENKQQNLLANAVKRKISSDIKLPINEEKSSNKIEKSKNTLSKAEHIVLGILPGVGEYNSDETSSDSSDEDDDDELDDIPVAKKGK